MKPRLYYCYDAYCGWCYGFSPVIKKLAAEHAAQLDFEVLSGGMILSDKPAHIGGIAEYIKGAYKTVEEYSGIRFGDDYLWHILNPDQSDWFPDSLKSAIALCIFKEYFPSMQIVFASDLQYALHFEGRDLCDDEAYRHLLDKYLINAEDFYKKLHDPIYEEKARYEFALVKQLQVTGYPTVLIQTAPSKFYLVSRGFTDYETLSARVEAVLKELETQATS